MMFDPEDAASSPNQARIKSAYQKARARGNDDLGEALLEADALREQLSLAGRDRLTNLRRKVVTFRARGMSRADTLEAEMAEIAGVDDVDEIEWDAL